MKIVYDYQIFQRQKYGGISRYIYEIASRLDRFDESEAKILAGFYINKYLKKEDARFVIGYPNYYLTKPARVLDRINHTFSKIWLKKYQPNIIHETYYHPKDLWQSFNNCCKRVITVYDMIHEKFSYLLQTSKENTIQAKIKAIQRADRVICISENTKQDLLEFVKIDPQKVSVIYLGYAQPTRNADHFVFSIGEPYILYVGQRNVYKNFERLLKAYAGNRKINQDFKLVCFGAKNFSKTEIDSIEALGLNMERVQYVEGDDSILLSLYKQASAFIYPSLYEGFGIPPLEAMSCDCPVICSNISSIPEVVGNAAEFFNPYDVDSIGNAIEKVLYSEAIITDLIERGKERVKQFSWDDCVEKHSQLYASLT